MNIGMNETIGTVDSRPISPPAQPHWNTITITPYDAPMLSRLSSTALSGTSTDRKTSISSRNDMREHRGDEHRQPAVHPGPDVGEVRGLTRRRAPGRAARQRGREHRGCAAARRCRASPRPAGPVVGNATSVAMPGVVVHRRRRHRGDPRVGLDRVAPARSTAAGSPRRSTATTTRPLRAGPEALGHQVERPALGAARAAAHRRPGCPPAARARARRARAAAGDPDQVDPGCRRDVPDPPRPARRPARGLPARRARPCDAG